MPTPAAANVAACDAEGGTAAAANGKARARGVEGEEVEEQEEVGFGVDGVAAEDAEGVIWRREEKEKEKSKRDLSGKN